MQEHGHVLDHLDTPYARGARDWDALHFNVIPSMPGGKRPAWGVLWRDHHSPNSPRLSDPMELQLTPGEVTQLDEWAAKYPDALPLLLVDSGAERQLHVVDIDATGERREQCRDWALRTYGKPLQEVDSTSGGLHMRYVAPLTIPRGYADRWRTHCRIVGPPEMIKYELVYDEERQLWYMPPDFGTSSIDVKRRGSYTVLWEYAGHELRGAPTTREALLAATPLVFDDRELVERLKTKAAEERARVKAWMLKEQGEVWKRFKNGRWRLLGEPLRRPTVVVDEQIEAERDRAERRREERAERKSTRRSNKSAGRNRSERRAADTHERRQRKTSEVPHAADLDLDLDDVLVGDLAALLDCPAVIGAWDEADALSMEQWICLRSLIMYADDSDDGRLAWHAFSARDSGRYDPRQTEYEWQRGVEGRRFHPASYKTLLAGGWPGLDDELPDGSGPAVLVDRLRNQRAADALEDLGVEPEHIEKYLPEGALLGALKVGCYKAPLGSGKTERIRDLMNHYPRGTIVVQTILLAEDLAGRLGVRCYRDDAGPLSDDWCVVCAPSLHRRRVSLTGGEHVLVIEESEQTLDVLAGPLCRRRGGEIMSTLRHLVVLSARVVMLDAFLSNKSVRFAAHLGVPADQVQVRVFERKPGVKKVLRYPTIIDLGAAIERMVGQRKKVAVFCTTRTATKRLGAMLAPYGRGQVYHGHSPKHVKNEIRDVNEHWAKLDWVVYNTAAGAGVSFDSKHFDEVAVVAPDRGRGGHAAWTDIAQGGLRVRRWSSRVVHAFVSERVHGQTCLREKIEEGERARVRCTRRTVVADGDGLYKDDFEATENSSHFAMVIDSTQAMRCRTRKTAEDYFQWWTSQGVPVLEARKMRMSKWCDAAKAWKAIGEELEELRLDMIEAAPTWTRSDYWQVRRHGPGDDPERSAIERFRLLDTFGESAVGGLRNIAHDDRYRALTDEAWLLASVAAVADGRREAAMQDERWVYQTGLDGLHRHRGTRARLAARMLRDLGLDFGGVADLLAVGVHTSPMIDLALARCGQWTATSLEALGAARKARRWLNADGVPELLEDLGALGFVRGVAQGRSACALVGILLKLMGISTASAKVTVSATKRENAYWVDEESLVRACSRARRCYRRLRGEKVPEPLDLDSASQAGGERSPEPEPEIRLTGVDEFLRRMGVSEAAVPG